MLSPALNHQPTKGSLKPTQKLNLWSIPILTGGSIVSSSVWPEIHGLLMKLFQLDEPIKARTVNYLRMECCTSVKWLRQ